MRSFQDSDLCATGMPCIRRPLAQFRICGRLIHMTDEEFERYLDLCKRLFEKMRRENVWPWTDSPDFEDVVDSAEGNNNDI